MSLETSESGQLHVAIESALPWSEANFKCLNSQLHKCVKYRGKVSQEGEDDILANSYVVFMNYILTAYFFKPSKVSLLQTSLIKKKLKNNSELYITYKLKLIIMFKTNSVSSPLHTYC